MQGQRGDDAGANAEPARCECGANAGQSCSSAGVSALQMRRALVVLMRRQRWVSFVDRKQGVGQCGANAGGSAEAVRRQCGGNAEAMRRQCGGNAEAMRRQCGGNAEAVRRQCGGNAEAMRRQCGGNAEAGVGLRLASSYARRLFAVPFPRMRSLCGAERQQERATDTVVIRGATWRQWELPAQTTVRSPCGSCADAKVNTDQRPRPAPSPTRVVGQGR
jgi:hypothetical protein